MKKGFTLIELLIVIAILAILATSVVLVLNPAQILAQARDSQRISDLGSVKSAIALYLATASSSAMIASSTCTVASCNSPFLNGVASSSTSTAVNGTGWVAGVDLTQTTGGSSLGALPLDPTQSTVYFYAYQGVSTSTFKLAGRLESTKYGPLMTTDGGTKNTCPQYPPVVGDTSCYYELGTNLAL